MADVISQQPESDTFTPWQALVRQIAGQPFPNEQTVATVCEKRLRKLLSLEAVDLLLRGLSPTFHSSTDSITRIVQATCSVNELLRTRPTIYLSTAISTLVEQGVLYQDETEETRLPTQKKLVFVLVGWITNMYVPDVVALNRPFKIDTEGATCFETTEIDPDIDNRPILEIVRELGDILPSRPPGSGLQNEPFQPDSLDILHVASLNIATLIRVGNFRIDWTSSISSHLDFNTAYLDPETGAMQPVLKLFRYPSLCYQFVQESSILHMHVQQLYSLHIFIY